MMSTTKIVYSNMALAIRNAMPMSIQKKLRACDVSRDERMFAYRVVIFLKDDSLISFYLDCEVTHSRGGEVPHFNDEFWTWITLLGNNSDLGKTKQEYAWHGYAGK